MPSSYDRYSKQPELKHAAVQVQAAQFSYQLVMMRTETDAAHATIMALQRSQRLAPLLDQFGFASVTILGRGQANIDAAHRASRIAL